VNHLAVAKRRSPRHVTHPKTTRREQDDDPSPADSGDEEQVSCGMEYSTDASNYGEDESVTSHSKEESGEEETDAEVEDTVDNGKGNLLTPVSRKGVTSDYDTPIADLLRHNRSRQPECNVTKHGPKLSQRKRRGRHIKKRSSTTSSKDNNEGALFYSCFYHQMSLLFFYARIPVITISIFLFYFRLFFGNYRISFL
jgi:hypothetical protein